VFLAIRDLRRNVRRFLLLGVVIALVALLSTVLSGLATGLVSDGISGLRALPLDHITFEEGAQATFSRSTLRADALEAYEGARGVDATPLGVSFVNASPVGGGHRLDLALFGVAADSFLLTRADARRAIAGPPGIVLSDQLRTDGVAVGDLYTLGASGEQLPVLGFTFGGTYGHAPIAYTSLGTWQSIAYGAGADGRFSALALQADGSANLGALDDRLGTESLTKGEAYAGSPGFTAETTTMSLIRNFLLVISALVIGAFFTVLTVQRTHQIGLLKAMGATNGYVLRDGISQMAVLVVFATAVGVALGVGAIAAVSTGDAPVELDPRSVLTSAVALVAAGVVGSLVAFRRTTQIEPAIALGAE
jgi:putative ABC transport system permease protein